MTDITYIRTLEGFAYLAVVIDLYLPKATVEKTRAGSYMRLLSGNAEDAA